MKCVWCVWVSKPVPSVSMDKMKPGANVIKNQKYKALYLVKTSHVTCNIESESFICL